MISNKKMYLSIAGGLAFFFLTIVILFTVIRVNKGVSFFENIGTVLALSLSLIVLLIGIVLSLFFAFKK